MYVVCNNWHWYFIL